MHGAMSLAWRGSIGQGPDQAEACSLAATTPWCREEACRSRRPALPVVLRSKPHPLAAATHFPPRVFASRRRLTVLPLVVPFHEIANHVVQAEAVGLQLATDVRTSTGVEAIPRNLLERRIDEAACRIRVLGNVPRVEGRPRTRAGRVLGFSSRWKTKPFALVNRLVRLGDAGAREIPAETARAVDGLVAQVEAPIL